MRCARLPSRDSAAILALIVLVLPVAAVYECASHWTGRQVLHDIGDPSMKGKTVVINGGDSGIGLGGATALAAAGADLIFLGYNSEKAQAAMKNITAVTTSTRRERERKQTSYIKRPKGFIL